MNGSLESPTGSLKSRRKDERNTGKLLTLWNHPGNDGKQPSMDKVKTSRLLKKKGYHIYIQRQSQKQHKIGITTDQTENSKNLSIPKSGIRQDKMRNCSRFGPVAKKILEADARHGILVFLYSSQLRNYLYTQFQNPPARQIVEFHRNSLGEL